MGNSYKQTAVGTILAVQENRFTVMTDDGRGLLLTLANSANASEDDLCHWHESHAHLRIDFEGEPNLTSGVAHWFTETYSS